MTMDARHWTGEPGPEHDPNLGGGVPYICTECTWSGHGGVAAAEHHVNTGHGVRGRRWPATWPNCIFTGVERRKEKQRA